MKTDSQVTDLLSSKDLDTLEALDGKFTWAILDQYDNIMDEGDLLPTTVRWMFLAEKDPGKWRMEPITYQIGDAKLRDLLERYAFEMAYAGQGQEGVRELKAHRERVARYKQITTP